MGVVVVVVDVVVVRIRVTQVGYESVFVFVELRKERRPIRVLPGGLSIDVSLISEKRRAQLEVLRDTNGIHLSGFHLHDWLISKVNSSSHSHKGLRMFQSHCRLPWELVCTTGIGVIGHGHTASSHYGVLLAKPTPQIKSKTKDGLTEP